MMSLKDRKLEVNERVYISSIVSSVFAALTLLFCGAAIYTIQSSLKTFSTDWYSLAFYAAGTRALLLAQKRLHLVRSEKDAHHAIAPVVHGYLLLLSAIAVAQKPEWVPGLVLFYAGFVTTMKFRPMATQI